MTDAYERPPVQAYRNPAPVSAGMRLIWENWDARGLRMCMEATEMYGGAAWVWGAYGDRKLMKTKNMAVECDLRTLCFFGNIRWAASGHGESFHRLSYLLSLGELLLACRAEGDLEGRPSPPSYRLSRAPIFQTA